MDFEIPASLDGLDLAALASLRTQAVDAFDTLKADTGLDADGLARLKALASCVKDVDSRSGDLETQAAVLQAEIDALDAEVHGSDDSHDDSVDGDDIDNSGGDKPTGAADPADNDGDNGGDVDGAAAPAGDVAKVPAMASVAKAAARQRKPAPKNVPASRSAKVLAAANVANRPHNSAYRDARDLAKAFSDAFAAFPNNAGAPASVATRLSANVARIELPYDEQFMLGRGQDDWDVIDAAASQTRLPGGNLVAAGSWCALNERLWDLCPGLETAEGLWDVPEFTLRRPGVQYPGGLDFRDLYAGVGFVWNEASVPPKPCYQIPCPTFPEWRMEVDGICLRQDIIAQAMWPEWTRDVIRRAPVAHRHKINARLLALAFTTQAAGVPPQGNTAYTLTLGSDVTGDTTTTGLMGGLSIAATHIRYQYRAQDSMVVEGIAPLWLREWIRADLARAKGLMLWEISDQQIDNWFLRRKIRLQWVYDLQDGYVDPAGFGAVAPPGQWPAEVKVLLYPAGTFTLGTRPIIDLSAVYDSTNLEKNEYIAVFSEQATLLVKRCFASYLVTLPLCPTGARSADATYGCTVVPFTSSEPQVFDVSAGPEAQALNGGAGVGGEGTGPEGGGVQMPPADGGDGGAQTPPADGADTTATTRRGGKGDAK